MSGGVLRTGDLATVDDDGFIYVVDRAEDFIKSWGYRIASTDVEAAAMELPGLVAAAAVGVPDERAGERVELAVVLRDGSELTERDVIAHCRRRLAKFMVPSRVHVLSALPANANGKVVKRTIRQQCIERAAREAQSSVEAVPS
jgi:acyl-CoA synthetase (AMP-forming)/AMP-acid ligase II